jgi:hypothetical protein
MALVTFGLYLIPEAGEFYEKGSSVVGYDIRNQKVLPQLSFVQPEWNETNRQYGWHITITDALRIEEDQLPHIVGTVKGLLACLREENVYSLMKLSLGFWPETSKQVALRLNPNRNVELLHDILVAVIHPMGQGSVYYDTYMADKGSYFQNDSHSRIAKTERFYSPYVLDQFAPHMTCVNPFVGTPSERSLLLSELDNLFSDVTELRFDKLTMVVRGQDESLFRVFKEFDLHGTV